MDEVKIKTNLKKKIQQSICDKSKKSWKQKSLLITNNVREVTEEVKRTKRKCNSTSKNYEVLDFFHFDRGF